MTATAPHLLAETERAQSAASDPLASAWVSANAGAGKTHVLKMRVLRLLLAGTAPERIMCLTYTKAAAAEMSQRIFDDLAKWATASADDLASSLHKLLGRTADRLEVERARRLFAAAIETPGGLKVQTIHAFCERLLQRFPLEAGVPPGFQILDDEMAQTLRREAIEGMLIAATRNKASSLGRALETAIAYATSDSFDDVLANAIRRHAWLEQMFRLDLRGDAGELDQAEALYRQLLGLAASDHRAGVEAEMANLVPDAELVRLRDVLAGGSKKDLTAAEAVSVVRAAPSPALRINALSALLLTGEGEPRANLMTKALATAHPDIAASMDRATRRLVALAEKRRALTILEATMALVHLAGDVLQRFQAAKGQRAALDFDDLIRRTANLLVGGQATAWVLFKLDGGLDHILVDEAQDTSPVQWSIVEALAAEFFVGTGTAETVRTLFAVGDEKQSIYSFQGAAPKMFADTGARFAEICRSAGIDWRQLPLQLSFRTVAPLLDAVDRIFSDPVRARGLTSGAESLRHIALRQGQAGLIEVWPVEQPAEEASADPWQPLGDRVGIAPAVRVARRIAATIAHWLENGETLTSENRPIHAGDILILVRNRRPFAGAMVAALKARGIPVAGADRMRLTDQIAVQDLIALGDFLTLPEDDLALATVLKSPLFDLDDDDLLAIAPARKGTLWSAVIDRAKTDPRFQPAAVALKRWRSDADYLPPFEFFAKILDGASADGLSVRARLLRRLGPDAADPIDEFLNRAIAYDEQSPPSMLGFLTWLRGGVHEIKRDMEQTRQEVRVMTVHGAKGLEAPILFLPDTTSASSRQTSDALAALSGHTLPSGIDAPFAWAVKGAGQLNVIAAAQADAKRAEAEEHKRLLYVALTRPRDRLYVAGFQGKRKLAPDCWYELVRQGLDGLLAPAVAADGGGVLRIVAAQTAAHEPVRGGALATVQRQPLPDWATRPALREANLVVPLAPSRIAALETDEAGEPLVNADPLPPAPGAADIGAPSPLVLAGGDRFLRGTLTHALLEHLPSVPPATWERAAPAFLEKRARTLSAATRTSIAREAIAVLREPTFAAVFGPDSQAEVPIIGEIENPRKGLARLRIFGQIDRLIAMPDQVLIVDYKTNRPPPQQVADVPLAYLYQLASYRLVLSQIYGARPVRAAILWTDGARLMPIPDALLDQHQDMLWQLGSQRLDGAGGHP
jgi:ATP-dependent helicase/nuclease subunit A